MTYDISPSLEAEIRRLCREHGKDAVRETAARLTKARVRDRLLTADLDQLRPFVETEARRFLENKKKTAHTKIVAAVMATYSVHSRDADQRRMLKRLASSEWKFRVMVLAFYIGEIEYSLEAYIRVCREALKIPRMAYFARLELDNIDAETQRLSTRVGEVPPTMTRRQLEDEASITTLGLLGKIAPGLLSQSPIGVANAEFRDMSPTVKNKSEDRGANRL